MAANKQPIFTLTPVLKTTVITSSTIFNVTDIANSTTEILAAGSAVGTLIDRITVGARADDSTNNVSDKLIYITVFDGATHSVLKVFKFAATTVSDTVLPPREVITFEGGIVLKQGDTLRIGQTVDGSSGGEGLCVVVEGGTYD